MEKVLALAGGAYAVTWQSAGEDGSGYGIYARLVDNTIWEGGSGSDAIIGGAFSDMPVGGDGNDTLDGGPGADVLTGGLGNDTFVVDNADDVVIENAGEGTDLVQSSVTYTLVANVENLTLTGTSAVNGTGNTLDNRLIGNSGINTLTGGAGNDTLDGGAGNDTLTGGTGADTYLFGVGGGSDVIVNTGQATDGDKVLFGSGIAVDQLWFQQAANDLKVSIIGTNDSVTVTGWFASNTNHVSTLQAADGHSLADTAVQNLVAAMASMTPPPAGQTTLTADQHQQLDTVIAANWH